MIYQIKLFAAGLLGDAPSLGIPDNDLDATSLTTLLNGVYYIAGAIAVIVLIIAGIKYITGSGSADKVTKAKNTIIYTVVGLVLIICAFAITNFVLRRGV